MAKYVMANPGVILLILLAVILTIAIISVLIWAGVERHNDSNTGTTGGVILPPCNQNINISSLIQIPDTGSNCTQNGATGSLFYVGKLGGGKYDYVVAPWGTQTFDVCVGFCTGYTGGKCSGANYNGQSSQSNFDNCMKQLSSTGCAPPIPIAAKGTILYYPYTPTCNVCDTCGPTLANIDNLDLG